MRHAAYVVLLFIGVGVELLACLGLVAMRDSFSRLHYAAAGQTIGPIAVVLAVVVHEGLSSAGVKALVIAALFLVGGPILTHATARAARIVGRERP